MHDCDQSKADVHVHSKFSDRPSEWFLRRIGAPECFVEPLEIYRQARERGMDFVTISDHNCIRGALEIAHLPGTFVSCEVTTYFPEDGCKIHLLTMGIGEEQFRTIQELRPNIYELHKYLVEEDVLCSVSHPLYRVNGRLTIDHVEKLLLMFSRFETVNGTRSRHSAEIIDAVLRHLTPEAVADMAGRQGLEPSGSEPWRKTLTGGSDDHSGVNVASAYTVTPHAADVAEFLAHLQRGEHAAAGSCGGSVRMGHSLYHIAYSYYKDRLLRNSSDGKPNLLGVLFQRLLESTEEKKPPGRLRRMVRGLYAGVVGNRQMKRFSDAERMLVEDFARLRSGERPSDTASPPMNDRRTFRVACDVGHVLGYNFFRRFVEFVRQGRLMESLQTVASLGPVALSMAPYLAAFSAQHKDEPFLRAIAAHFPSAAHLRGLGERKAWLTDTYSEVNGVSRTIQVLAATARTVGRPLTVLTCQESIPTGKADVKNFLPVGTFPMPEYESQPIAFPPFMEVIEYIERQRFNELIISTPGPMGLVGLAAARVLGLPTTSIYHTDFVQYVRFLTQDDELADLTWKFMLWFYEQSDAILVPTEFYRKQLIHHGFDPAKLAVMARGVDTRLFHPDKRDPRFFACRGLHGEFTFIYVGRVSKEKNLDALFAAFEQFQGRGHHAGLAIVGDGPYRAELQDRWQSPAIVFTGLLEGEELATAYASADTMVFPSTTDTFGNVVLEAQASGVPVIVTDRGGPADIVRSHNSGLIVDHTCTEAIAEAMEQLFLSPTLRADLRIRGLRNAAESSWQQVLDDLWHSEEDDRCDTTISAYRSSDPRTAPGVITSEVA